MFFSGPIIRRNPENIELAKIKSKYNIKAGEKTILVTNGGGNSIHDDGFINAVVEIFNEIDKSLPNYKLILLTGPLVEEQTTNFKHKWDSNRT